MKEFSVQHYTFRPLSNERGLFPVLEEVSKMGYTGLEMCCFGGFEPLGISAGELRSRLEDLGMHMVGNHFTRDLFHGSHERAFDYIAQAGGKYAIYNIWGSYDTQDDVMDKADYLNALSAMAQRTGITLLYHNHAAEFAEMNGQLIIDRLEAALDPAVYFETDVFFAKQQNCDIASYIRTHAHRIRTVHLKQINALGENVDLPDGIIDMAQVVGCATEATDFILEQAAFPIGISESLRRNADFLKAL